MRPLQIKLFLFNLQFSLFYIFIVMDEVVFKLKIARSFSYHVSITVKQSCCLSIKFLAVKFGYQKLTYIQIYTTQRDKLLS